MMDGLRAALKAGKPQIGTYVTFPSPEIVELFAAAGMDYVVIDLQHSSPDWQTLAHMIRAAEAGFRPSSASTATSPPSFSKSWNWGPKVSRFPVSGMPPISERPSMPSTILRSKDSGACGHTRVAGYNSRRSEFPEHVKRQHDRVLIWALIEDPEAISNVEEIASVRRSGLNRRGSRRPLSCAWPTGADRSPYRH